MSATAHTPGPWTAAGLTVYEAEGAHRDICEMFSCHEHTVSITEAEAEANAHLIATSPAMLAKLEELYTYFDGIGDGAPDASYTQLNALNQAAEIRSLIEKARGGR